MRSAYMLDHLYYVSLFKDYKSHSSTQVKALQPLVLQDLRAIFCVKSPLFSKDYDQYLNCKNSLVEGMLRYYDFVHGVE